jgi:SAM-dependent methyltransferase
MFDLVIIYNSLDHAFAPTKVLSESNRVLRSGAILHVAVHAYPVIGLPTLKLLKFIQRSKDHPWRYTVASIKADLGAHSFKTIDAKYGSKDEESIPNWLPLTPKLRIARLVGMCAPMFHVLAKKVKRNLQDIR